jgi:dihydroorotase
MNEALGVRCQVVNARVVDPASGRDKPGPIYIAEGKILAIDKAPDGFRADETIDAAGLVACPGLVDLAARLREPGFEYKATLESEMRAAVAGGVTTLACPPDTDPPLDELTLGLKGERLAEMAELTDAGCVGFSQGHFPLPDTRTLLNALRYAATLGFTVWVRPEDASLAAGGVAHTGEVSTRLGLPSIPTIAETLAIRTLLELMSATGARVHLERISSAAGVALVAQAKKQGATLTCDVSIHHLHLCDRDIGEFDSNCRLAPPLREPSDRDALRRAAAEGIIDAVCSDHAPVDEDAKQVPFGEAETGATALELLLPLTLQWGRESGLKLPETLAAVSSRPAKILGVPAGSLAPGAAADICLFDPDKPWVVRADALASQGKNTPFIGMEIVGKVVRTIVGGRTVYGNQQSGISN